MAANEPRPEGTFYEAWQAEQITAALGKISETHRAVIELAFVQEFSHEEIAEIMGCPVGTVKSRMSYALRHLRGILLGMNVTRQDD